MKVQFLVSTMHQTDFDLVKKMKMNCHALLINQNDTLDNVIESEIDGFKYKMISVIDRGLSKSRNLALDNALAKYCLLADDDLQYFDSSALVVEEYHEKYPQYDIIAFNIKNFKDGLLKKNKVLKVNWLTAMKLSSVQLSFKLKSLQKKNIRFNTDFGAGAKYICNEENIFLNDCLKAGLKILYVPKTIGVLKESESTWFTGFNQLFFRTKGAAFTELSKRASVLLILQFAIRKHKFYKHEMSFTNALRHMMDGRREYIDSKKDKKVSIED